MSSNNKVNCQSPVLILSSKAYEYSLNCDCYFVDGHKFFINAHQKSDILSGEKVSKVLGLPYVQNITKKDGWTDAQFCAARHRLDNFLNDSFFLSNNGECHPIWEFVPCGHCDACLNKKLTSYLQRAEFAYQECKSDCYFVTLTYNDCHLPKDGQPCRRDVQLFFKRLRKCFSDATIKYVYASEQGKLGRTHYHTVIYGLPVLDKNEPRQRYLINKYIQYCWREPERLNGRYMSFKEYIKKYPKAFCQPKGYDSKQYGFPNVELIDGGKVVSYVLKYAFKDSFRSGEDQNVNNFKSVSSNLGLGFLQPFVKFIKSSPDGKFSYAPFDNPTNIKSVSLCGYYLKKLFPSKSELIPADFRKSYFNVHYLANYIYNHPLATPSLKSGAMSTLIYLTQRFPIMPLFNYTYESYKPKHLTDVAINTTFDNLRDDCVALAQCFQKCLEYDFNIDEINQKLYEREVFFNKMKSRTDGQIADVGKNFRRTLIINHSKSIL